MRTILTGIIIFVIILFFWFLLGGKKREQNRTSQKEKGSGKIERCFDTLELKPGASREELEQGYRDLVNVWHPDRFNHNTRLQEKAQEKLKEINAAYEYIRSFYRWK
jgi:DnaJ-class molecular chaperone